MHFGQALLARFKAKPADQIDKFELRLIAMQVRRQMAPKRPLFKTRLARLAA